MRLYLLTLLTLSLVFCHGLNQTHAQAPDTEPEAEGAEGDDPGGTSTVRREELSDAAAMSLFNAASSLFEAGRFLDAAQQFEAAYELSPRPMLLFNIYLSYRDAGRNQAAVRALAEYLRAAPEAEDAERLTNRLAAMRVSAEQEVADEEAAAAERERLAAEAEEARRRAEAESTRADEAEITTRNPIGIIVSAVGGAALVVGGVTAVVANNRFNTLQDNCPSQFCSVAADLSTNRPSIRRLQRATDGLLFGGAAVLVTGLVLTFVLKPKTPPAAEPTASCSTHSCELGVRGSF